MLLKSDHISYAAQAKVKELLKPLTDQAGISYFCYGVNYRDTSGFSLHTNSRFYESWFNQKGTLRGFYLGKGWYSFDHLLPQSVLEVAKEENIGNMVTYIEHQPDKTIILEFGSSPEKTEVLDFYLNNQNLLRRFGHYFVREAQDYINVANEQLITPSEIMMQGNPQSCDDALDLLIENVTHPLNMLSRMELQCFYLLLKGYSYVEIGGMYHLSPKTINAYFTRIKNKLDCTSRHELVEMARQAGLIDFGALIAQ